MWQEFFENVKETLSIYDHTRQHRMCVYSYRKAGVVLNVRLWTSQHGPAAKLAVLIGLMTTKCLPTTFRRKLNGPDWIVNDSLRRYCRYWQQVVKEFWRKDAFAPPPTPQKLPLFLGNLDLSPNTWFLGLTWVHAPNGILISSAVLAQLMVVLMKNLCVSQFQR